MDEITLEVTENTAKIYRNFPKDEQEKLQVMFDFLVREYTASNPNQLKHRMNEMSQKAKARGLTPEILDAILAE